MPEMLKRFWAAWKRIAHKIGTFQARVLLTVIYLVAVLPFGLAIRLFADPLRTKKHPGEWLERDDPKFDLGWARRQ